MLHKLKHYLSIITLSVFLFPMVLEELHQFEHKADFHCSETHAKHIHLPEHHCSICDFVLSFSTPPIAIGQIPLCSLGLKLNSESFPQTVFKQHKYTFPRRGPPFIS